MKHLRMNHQRSTEVNEIANRNKNLCSFFNVAICPYCTNAAVPKLPATLYWRDVRQTYIYMLIDVSTLYS